MATNIIQDPHGMFTEPVAEQERILKQRDSLLDFKAARVSLNDAAINLKFASKEIHNLVSIAKEIKKAVSNQFFSLSTQDIDVKSDAFKNIEVTKAISSENTLSVVERMQGKNNSQTVRFMETMNKVSKFVNNVPNLDTHTLPFKSSFVRADLVRDIKGPLEELQYQKNAGLTVGDVERLVSSIQEALTTHMNNATSAAQCFNTHLTGKSVKGDEIDFASQAKLISTITNEQTILKAIISFIKNGDQKNFETIMRLAGPNVELYEDIVRSIHSQAPQHLHIMMKAYTNAGGNPNDVSEIVNPRTIQNKTDDEFDTDFPESEDEDFPEAPAAPSAAAAASSATPTNQRAEEGAADLSGAAGSLAAALASMPEDLYSWSDDDDSGDEEDTSAKAAEAAAPARNSGGLAQQLQSALAAMKQN